MDASFIRALICSFTIAGSVFLLEDAQAQGILRTEIYPVPTVTLSTADFLLGKPDVFIQRAFFYRAQNRNLPSLYFIDTWKMSRRLTLSLGVRWNPLVPMLDAHGQQALFSPAAFAAGTKLTGVWRTDVCGS